MIKSIYYTPEDGLQVFEGLQDFKNLTAQDNSILWVDMIDPTDEESYILTSDFKFHPLAVEDVLSEMAQPKVDDYDQYIFTVALVLGSPLQEEDISVKPIGIFLSKNSVVTVHFQKMQPLAKVADRVEKDSRIIKRGADFLFHTILDYIVDTYFSALNTFEKEIDNVEVAVFENPDEKILRDMFWIRRDLSIMRRVIVPQAEVISGFAKGKFDLVQEEAAIYFSDIHDHLQVILSDAGNQRESITSAMDLYFSMVSTKTNEIIKFLTVLSALLLPATFIVGFYGMNFEFMPELNWQYGYPVVILIILSVVIGLLFFFRRKKWI